MFLKDIWPTSKLAIYCEFFYQHNGSDIDFDPEFPSLQLSDPRRIRIKNLVIFFISISQMPDFHQRFGRLILPTSFRSKITVIHDGIDTIL